MPFQVKAGSVTAIVANEKQALEMVRRLTGPSRGQVSIRDVFGDEIDITTLEKRLSGFEHDPYKRKCP